VFFPLALDVHALKDCLTMSLTSWLVLLIPPSTCMEKEKGKKALSKNKNQIKQNIAILIILTCG
jgi:hypothetical protein